MRRLSLRVGEKKGLLYYIILWCGTPASLYHRHPIAVIILEQHAQNS